MAIEIGNASGVIPLNVGNMDLESALMAVQTNRANALEAGLKDQIAMVQKKNEKIAGLNDLLSAMNVAQAKVDAQAKAGDATNISAADLAAITQAARNAGVSPVPDLATKGKLDGQVTALKSTIDGLSNTQQMDMLRLQSMSNKRNEAFEIMTNFIKKQADNRSSIVGNMR
jgi:hypothetical protein